MIGIVLALPLSSLPLSSSSFFFFFSNWNRAALLYSRSGRGTTKYHRVLDVVRLLLVAICICWESTQITASITCTYYYQLLKEMWWLPRDIIIYAVVCSRVVSSLYFRHAYDCIVREVTNVLPFLQLQGSIHTYSVLACIFEHIGGTFSVQIHLL